TQPGVTGNAGTVMVQADNIEIYSGAEISSSTVGVGNAGSVRIQAGRLLVNGQSSRVASESFGAGDAGALLLDIGTLEVTDGGLISSTTTTTGAGGSITLMADSLLIDGG